MLVSKIGRPWKFCVFAINTLVSVVFDVEESPQKIWNFVETLTRHICSSVQIFKSLVWIVLLQGLNKFQNHLFYNPFFMLPKRPSLAGDGAILQVSSYWEFTFHRQFSFSDYMNFGTIFFFAIFIFCLLNCGVMGPETVTGLGLLEAVCQFWQFSGGDGADCPSGWQRHMVTGEERENMGITLPWPAGYYWALACWADGV